MNGHSSRELVVPEPQILLPGDESVRLFICPHPFKTEREEHIFDAGLTIGEMFEAVGFDTSMPVTAHVTIDGLPIPRENWHRVRPKPGYVVSIRVAPMFGGGGDRGGKSTLRVVLTIAVIAASFAAPALLPAEGALAAGSTVFGSLTVGQLVSAATGWAGVVLVNASAPPVPS